VRPAIAGYDSLVGNRVGQKGNPQCLAAFGGLGGGYYGYSHYGPGGGGGILVVVLIICVVLYLLRGRRL
jgi:hypothetical protein